MTTNTKAKIVEAPALTKAEKVQADVTALLRARNPLLWVVTREEARAERYLFEAAADAGYVPYTWDVAQGVADIAGNVKSNVGSPDPGDTLDAIRERARRTASGERCVWVMRDLPVWLAGPPGASVMRKVRNLANMLPGCARESAQAIIVLTPSAEIPPELAGNATVIEWPLPDREELNELLDVVISSQKQELRDRLTINGERASIVDSAVGLSEEEANASFSKSIVQFGKIDPVAIGQEKKRIISRERVLTWYDPLPGGMDAVGGLENLKGWFKAHAAAYTPDAIAYGLPKPKGLLLVGIPGCGKTLTSKAVATFLGWPLLQFDFGALKDKFVGGSEANARKAYNTIEAVGRAVVWIDEIEKGLAGATQGGADGGVSADQLGSFLSWMQERRGEAFVIATANNIETLPPELLRKGRFDEVFFVDLPDEAETVAILAATLRSFKRDASGIDLARVARQCRADGKYGFTGSEIAALIPEAMFTAYSDGKRELRTEDLIVAAGSVVPLSKTSEEKVAKLREWANGRAKPASLVASSSAPAAARSRARIVE